MILRISVFVIGVGLAIGCRRDLPGVSLAEAPGAFATAYCARAFACCEPVERDALLPDVTDVASCEAFVARVFGNEFVDDTNRSEAAGRSSYDAVALGTCLDHLQSDDCSHLVRTFQRMTFPADCDTVRVPRVAIGGDCDHDFQCESGACASADDVNGQCEEVPAIGAPCPTGDCGSEAFCDRTGASPVCSPIVPDGSACTSALACESLECVGGVCVAPTTCNGI